MSQILSTAPLKRLAGNLNEHAVCIVILLLGSETSGQALEILILIALISGETSSDKAAI